MSGVTTKVVTEDEAEMRLDRWFKSHFPALGHGRLEKYLRKGQVRVDGGRAKANRRLAPGETIRIPPLDDSDAPRPARARPKRDVEQDAAFLREITLFEDESIIAFNKPYGIAVQGGVKTTRHIDAMLAALGSRDDRPRLVHRLDRDTSGLLIVAKTRQAAAKLSGAFQRHEIEKTYWALVAGAPKPREGAIDMKIAPKMVRVGSGDQERMTPADDDEAKKAITDFQTLDDAGQGAAFLALRPLTGRKHQLRVHCAAIGAPIAGDRKYGGERAIIDGVAPKLHLFCRMMTFPHPKTGARTTLTAPLSGHMLETWRFFGFDADATCEWPEGIR